MNNYFETQTIHWHNFAPENIIFKSNNITKKLMPKENVLSYSSKGNRDDLMAKKTGEKLVKNNWGHSYYKGINHVAVHVRLRGVKQEYASADVDFVDLREKKDSLGGHCSGLSILVYVNSYHDKYDWQQGANNTGWQRVKANSKSLPDDEGYLICYGGQGDGNPMTHREFIEVADISEAVRKFLIDMVLPLKRGELNTKALTLVA